MKRFYSFILMAVLCCCVGSIQAAQLNEGFEGTSFPPDDWSTIHVSGNKAWARNTTYKNSGSASAQMAYNYSGGEENYLITPQLQPATGEKLSFYVSSQSYGGTTLTIEVSTTSANAADFTNVLATYTTGSSGSIGTTSLSTFVLKEIDLAEYVGQKIYIAFHVVDENGSNINLDDVTGVSFVPVSCPKPKTLAYTEVKNHSVKLSWTENGEATAWKIAYKKAADADYTVANADANPFVLNKLEASTAYVAKVQADCVDEQSDFSNEVSFTTLVACPVPAFKADSIKNILAHGADIHWGGDAANAKVFYRTAAYVDGLQETFDGTSIPSGWAQYSGALEDIVAGTAEFTSGYKWSFGAGNGVFDNHARINVYSSHTSWLVSPEFKAKDGASLKFDVALTAYNGTVQAPAAQTTAVFAVVVKENNTWTVLRKWDNEGEYIYGDIACSATGENVSIDLSSYSNKNIQVAFYAANSSEGDNNLHIDNVMVGDAYEAGEWQEVKASGNSAQLSGLLAEKLYDVKVQAVCGDEDGNSDESAIAQFTTVSDCQVPDGLEANNITANAATISWNGYGKTEFNLQYRVKGSEDPMTVKSGVANNYVLDGLTANTQYEVKVQPTCAGEEEWSALLYFRTACANVTAFPWNEDFEDYDANTIPFCWDNSASASTTINSTPSYIWGVYSDNDNKLLRMYNFMVQAGTALINSPVIELPASPAQQLTFDYAHNASCADLTVKISEDNGENWTALQSYTKSGTNDYNHAGEMTEATISLADYAGKTIMLQFFTTADYSQGGIFLDNISIHEVPSCSKPEVNAPVILPDGATISWTAGNDETRFEYACVVKDAELADTDWILLNEDVLSVTINGKASGVSYDFYVRAYCSASEKSEAVKKTFKALCPAPTALQVTDIASKSATISWTAAEGISNYQYVVMAGDDAADWTSATLVEGAVIANLTNLAAATSYTVYVRSHYSDVSYSSAISKDFTTECEAFNLPLSENFNDLYSGIPNCWDNSEGTSTYSSKWNSYSTGHEGKGLRFDSYNNGRNNTNVLATPTIHLDKDAILSFWCKNPNGGAYEVKIAQAGSETRATLFGDLTSISAWTQKEADLSAYTGKDVVIYFCGTSNYGSYDAYLYLDDVEIYEKPACSKPSALQISNIETTSATIAWTAGGNETAWQICVNGDEEHLIDAKANPFTLTDLTASTAYSVKVRAICGSEDMSDWSNAADFRTECANITILPWNENLESLDANTVPACWDNSASTTTDLSSYPYYVWGVYEYSSNKMLRMNNYSLHTGTAQINTPVIELPASPAYELTFDYSHTATCGDFVVKVSADNGANWSNVKTLTKGSGSSYTDPGEFTLETVNLADYAGKSIMLQFFANANWGSGAIFVDNLSIHEVPSCAKPSDVQISNIAQSSATIAWTAGGDETAWQICLNGDEENLIDADANPFELTNLAANTAYSVKVRAICGDDHSDWSNAANFRTACGAVALPFNEDFEDGIDCWTLVNCESSTGISADAKKEGSYGFRFRYNSNPPQYLISPELIASDKPVDVEFYYKNYSNSNIETFKVGYSTSTNDISDFTWDAEETSVADYTTWGHYSDTKPANVKYVAIQYTSYDKFYLYIDDFSVTVSGSDQTAVDNTVNGAQIIKRIENGLLLIEVNGVIYNAQGEVVTK